MIGGGFIGSEIAAALVMNACSVTMVFPEPGIGARIFPAELSALITDYYRERGVEVLAGASVTTIERDGDEVRLATADGRTLEANAVVAGLGIEPRVELGSAADELHREIGAYARESGVERLLAFGPRAKWAAEAFGAGAAWFENVEDLIAEARRSLRNDVAVLVKGSRANRLERVTQALAPESSEVS